MHLRKAMHRSLAAVNLQSRRGGGVVPVSTWGSQPNNLGFTSSRGYAQSSAELRAQIDAFQGIVSAASPPTDSDEAVVWHASKWTHTLCQHLQHGIPRNDAPAVHGGVRDFFLSSGVCGDSLESSFHSLPQRRGWPHGPLESASIEHWQGGLHRVLAKHEGAAEPRVVALCGYVPYVEDQVSNGKELLAYQRLFHNSGQSVLIQGAPAHVLPVVLTLPCMHFLVKLHEAIRQGEGVFLGGAEGVGKSYLLEAVRSILLAGSDSSLAFLHKPETINECHEVKEREIVHFFDKRGIQLLPAEQGERSPSGMPVQRTELSQTASQHQALLHGLFLDEAEYFVSDFGRPVRMDPTRRAEIVLTQLLASRVGCTPGTFHVVAATPRELRKPLQATNHASRFELRPPDVDDMAAVLLTASHFLHHVNNQTITPPDGRAFHASRKWCDLNQTALSSLSVAQACTIAAAYGCNMRSIMIYLDTEQEHGGKDPLFQTQDRYTRLCDGLRCVLAQHAIVQQLPFPETSTGRGANGACAPSAGGEHLRATQLLQEASCAIQPAATQVHPPELVLTNDFAMRAISCTLDALHARFLPLTAAVLSRAVICSSGSRIHDRVPVLVYMRLLMSHGLQWRKGESGEGYVLRKIVDSVPALTGRGFRRFHYPPRSTRTDAILGLPWCNGPRLYESDMLGRSTVLGSAACRLHEAQELSHSATQRGLIRMAHGFPHVSAIDIQYNRDVEAHILTMYIATDQPLQQHGAAAWQATVQHALRPAATASRRQADTDFSRPGNSSSDGLLSKLAALLRGATASTGSRKQPRPPPPSIRVPPVWGGLFAFAGVPDYTAQPAADGDGATWTQRRGVCAEEVLQTGHVGSLAQGTSFVNVLLASLGVPLVVRRSVTHVPSADGDGTECKLDLRVAVDDTLAKEMWLQQRSGNVHKWPRRCLEEWRDEVDTQWTLQIVYVCDQPGADSAHAMQRYSACFEASCVDFAFKEQLLHPSAESMRSWWPKPPRRLPVGTRRAQEESS